MWNMADFRTELAPKGSKLKIFYQEKKIGHVDINRDFSRHYNSLYVALIFINFRHRSKGFIFPIMDIIIDLAQKMGYSAIELDTPWIVTEYGMKCHKMYEAFGFEPKEDHGGLIYRIHE